MDINRKLFLEKNIGPLLFKFSAPAVVAMSAVAFCTIADSIFVGHFIGTTGLAATTLALPIFMFFSAISNTIGIGGAAIWSVDMGAQKFERAQKVFASVILLNIILGLSILAFGLIFLEYILQFLGTPPDVYPMAKVFIGILFITSFFTIFTISTNNFIRAEGKPVTSMVIIFIVAVMIIILDFVFIYLLNFGIKGAALSALIGHAIATAIIAWHFTFGGSQIKIKKENFVFAPAIMIEILKIGAASFLRQFSIAVMHFVVNISVVWYAGLKAGVTLAIVGICFRMIMFILMPVIGVIQGMQPIIGFNYGAGLFSRARKTILLAILGSTCIASLSWMLIMLFPEAVLKIFSRDPELLNNGSHVVRFLICAMPFVAAQTTGAGLFQVLKKPVPASFFAALRQIILLVPIILVVPVFFGLEGVWYSVPIADFLAFFITAIWVIKEINSLESLHKEKAPA